MSDVTKTVDAYVATWNETDPAKRLETIRTAWTDEGHYVDPLMESKGHEGLSAMIEGVQAQFPGHRIRRTSGVDLHHTLIRFGWELVGDDGTVAVAGLDVGVLADDGRLSRIAGFLGDLPATDEDAAAA
jgi:hypothetical protein